jgi:cysteine desulfurase
MKLPIYMDNHATTPMDPRVLETMLPFFTEDFGNAASRNHVFGWRAEEAVEKARKQLADVINAKPKEIVFTSGATESDNLAIRGVADLYQSKGNHIITVETEHKAVLDTCHRLQKNGFEITYLTVDKDGLVTPAQVSEAITNKTILVSIMAANNEIGVLQPLAEIGAICRDRGVLFHTDATQAYGRVPIDVQSMNIDLASISAHKIYGPKGVGALYVKKTKPRVRISPIIDGGGHERGMRSGTLNTAGIVGFGKAAELCHQEMEKDNEHCARLRDRMWNKLSSELDEIYVNGHEDHRLTGNLNVSFAYVEGESLMMGLEDIAVSSGSACTSATLEPSYVLHALGVGDDLAHSSLRFGIGRFNTEEEVDYVAGKVIEAVKRLREMSPLYELAKEGVDLSAVEWREPRY